MQFTQENRFLAIDTPLGRDVLLLTSFKGKEAVSRPFNFELSLVSASPNIPFEKIIGQNITVTVLLSDGSKRFYNGIVSRFAQGGGGGQPGGDLHLSNYRAVMVPWLWLLTRNANSRIFQSLSAPEIAEKIFKEKGLTDFKVKLHSSYAKRDYCVQYRETDFGFVSRLLEDEGIYYYFEHEDKKHTLVLADVPEGHEYCPEQKSAKYQTNAGGWEEEDVVTALEKSQEIRFGQYTLNDFNFEIPNTDLTVNVPSKQSLGPGDREIYDYPGLYSNRADGDRVAGIRMQEEEARITTITGKSVCRAFTSGYRFELQNHYRTDMAGKAFVLTSIELEAGQPYLPQDADTEFSYENSFTCIPFDVPYRPTRNTPRPVVRGTQTAVVVGPKGEEIYTDEHGRIKVQFHWDREGKRDDKSSCWIRVSQAWAGSGWGFMSIPRIGHEVIVDFIEGDPDRPIVIGSVYHGINKPPYELPGDKTKSTLKSDSSLGSGGFNELRFEDKKGQEEIFLHGQKDWTIAIENDKNQTVGKNESLSVGSNRTKTVGADEDVTIGANKSSSIGRNKTETVAINTAETIGAAKELTIGGLYQISVGGAMNETVGAAKAEEIGAAKAVIVGGNSSENVGKDKSVSVGKNYKCEVTENGDILVGKKTKIQSGDDLTITGSKKAVISIDDQLTIKCGSASIIMKKNGDIEIKGKKINIKGSADVKIKGSKIGEN